MNVIAFFLTYFSLMGSCTLLLHTLQVKCTVVSYAIVTLVILRCIYLFWPENPQKSLGVRCGIDIIYWVWPLCTDMEGYREISLLLSCLRVNSFLYIHFTSGGTNRVRVLMVRCNKPTYYILLTCVNPRWF